MPRINEGSREEEYRINRGEAPTVLPEQIAIENAKEVYESGEEARKVIKEFQLAKNAKTELEMVEHLREFNAALMDILEPVPTKNMAGSRILKDNDSGHMSTLRTLKWVVTGKKVPPDVDTLFNFATGSQGNRICFKNESEDMQEKSEDGNMRWMVYHEPQREDGEFAHKYWERFIAHFGSEWVDLLQKLEEKT